MNFSFQMIAVGLVVILSAVIGILLLTPSERSRRDRVRRSVENEKTGAPGKDWQEVSLRLERHIQGLRCAIDEHEKRERTLGRDLEVQREKYAKLQDKLAQERDWQKKEEEDVEKKAKEIAVMKIDLRRLDDELNRNHSERLKFERELRDAKADLDSVTQARRQLELQVQKLEAETDTMRKQIKELKWENSQLSEKKDAESWVPKEDFQKLEAELRNKDKDLARLREQIKKEA